VTTDARRVTGRTVRTHLLDGQEAAGDRRAQLQAGALGFCLTFLTGNRPANSSSLGLTLASLGIRLARSAVRAELRPLTLPPRNSSPSPGSGAWHYQLQALDRTLHARTATYSQSCTSKRRAAKIGPRRCTSLSLVQRALGPAALLLVVPDRHDRKVETPLSSLALALLPRLCGSRSRPRLFAPASRAEPRSDVDECASAPAAAQCRRAAPCAASRLLASSSRRRHRSRCAQSPPLSSLDAAQS